MTMRPDPTFHASPKLAMEAPPENFAYTLLLSPDSRSPTRSRSSTRSPARPRSVPNHRHRRLLRARRERPRCRAAECG
jgi:hypothetical protein